MPQFTQKKCPTCGGRLELISGNQYECRSCHNVYEMNERNANLYHDLQYASTFRESLNFKQAEMLYKNMLNDYKNEDLSDVYWNLLLCEQRVMFEKDQNGEQFPSFYDIVPKEIDESEYYEKAISYIKKYNPKNVSTYVNLVNKMSLAKKQYQTIKSTTKPYDIFICFKKSSIDEPNKLTRDHKLAVDLYNNLFKNYHVFFSDVSLNNIVIREYEPNIYHALYTARIMIVICSNKDYINSQWVKNEWSRFKMMSNTTAQAKSIIPIFRNNFKPEQLPDELRSCQGMKEDLNLMLNLTQAIKAIINPVDREAELAAKLRAEMQAQMQEQIKQMFAAQLEAQKPTAPIYNATYSQPKQQPTQPPKPVAPTTNEVPSQPKQHTTAPKPTTPNYIVPYGTKEIKDKQFKNRKDLTTAIIPNSVTSIENGAFEHCIGLTSITIPNSVTSIDSSAFSGCTGLTSITVEAGNTKYHSTGNCIIETAKKTLIVGCKSSVIPSNITSIDDAAFYYCTGLTSLTIPNSVTSIGWRAFEGCSSLTKMTIPFVGKAKNGTNATHLGYIFGAGSSSDNSSYVPSSLKEIIITDCQSIGECAFKGCSNLTSITIPDSVTSIGEEAFEGCASLGNITIPDSVTSIGNRAFRGCSSLTNITIPTRVTSIGNRTFSGCNGLVRITVANDNPKYHSVSNCLIETKTKTLIAGCNTSIIPTDGSVNSIDNRAFSGHSGLKSITIPSCVTKIEEAAFGGCSGLVSITVAKGNPRYHSVGNCLIETKTKTLIAGCKTSIVPTVGCVKSIGNFAFSGHSELTSITIPRCVTSIGDCALGWCSGLVSITVAKGNPKYHSAGNCLIETKTKTLIAGCKTSVIPAVGSVENIGKGAFLGCSELAGITIPISVTSIDDYAFQDCTKLTRINIPNDITNIGNGAFIRCESLKNIAIPDSVTNIGNSAFLGCSGLTNITSQSCTTSIGYNAFSDTAWYKNHPDGLVYTGKVVYAHKGISFDCYTIKQGTKGIASAAFNSDWILYEIIIPSSVTNIGDEAFFNCLNLKSIIYHGTLKQWGQVKKGEFWDNQTGDYIVHCTDGDIKK